jgi:hypothetical protein
MNSKHENKTEKAELVKLRKSLGIEAPRYISVIKSRAFYLDFIQSLRDNIWWEILVFSNMLLIGILVEDSKYPIFAMGIYTLFLVSLNACKFRMEVLTLRCEAYLKHLKDEKQRN